MIVDLPSTTTGTIGKKLISLRNEVGAMAMGRVLTLVVVVDETGADDAIAVANDATRQHPARIVVIVRGNGRGKQRLDAQIRVGGDAGASEIVVLRLYGALADHGEAVVTPLLLPDSPIVAWWPGDPPMDVAGSPFGQLAHHRITDATCCEKPGRQLKRRAQHYRSGDTDLSWTRITRWRALLAATLDNPPHQPVVSAAVTSEAECPGADLLAGWLAQALDVPVSRARSQPGSGLVSVRMVRAESVIDLVRVEGQVASLQQTGQPAREVALLEPGPAEALAAELRRLDPDSVYAAALCEGMPKVNKRRVTQSEAVRAGDVPQRPASVARQGQAHLGSRALERTNPTTGAPDATTLQTAVTGKLAAVQRGRVQIEADKTALAKAVAERIVRDLESAVNERDSAHLVLTGGSMGGAVVTALAKASAEAEFWTHVHLWWGDERFVSHGHADRNDQQAAEAGLGALGVPSASIHRLLGASPTAEESGDLAGLPAATADYAAQLAAQADPRDSMAVPRFDVTLLGMGPDAHVASLFPGRDEVLISDTAISTVSVAGSPKPPSLRVSLTVPALRASRAVYFVVTGVDKAEAVARAQHAQDDPNVPASWVRGQAETMWWLDVAAATELKET